MEQKIQIPEKVQITVSGRDIIVKGPRGELKRSFDDPRFNEDINFSVSGSDFFVRTESTKRRMLAVAGTISGHAKNMVIGVTKGYKYTMKIVYTHFPITVLVKGTDIEVKNFLGEKGVRKVKILGSSEVKADKEFITVTGNSIESVGQTAANIENSCKIGKRDRRIFIDGIYLSEKGFAQ